jgi:iron complex outermembrane recepter protein
MREIPTGLTRIAVRLLLAMSCALAAARCWAGPPPATDDGPTYYFNIPERDLDDALRVFGAVADLQILFSPDLVRAQRSAALRGRLSVTRALEILLSNTRLGYSRTSANVILVTQAAPAAMPLKVDSGSVSPIADAPASTSDPDVLEEIIVTAGKRRENVQHLAGSVLVVTGAVLDRANVRDFDDIVKVAPSVTITKTSQPGNNSINIRGIGTYAYSIATEPSVAVVIDDVPQAFQAAAFAALVDVQQVEVLRGPQNTLFGKSASAGVINITTQQPTEMFTARLDAMTTDDGEHRFSGTLSGPITQNLRGRLAANSSEYRGNVKNLTTRHWLNGTADTTLRGKLVWTPGGDWTVAFTPYYLETDASCCAGAEYFVTPGATTGNAATGPGRIPMSQFLSGITPGRGNRLARYDIDARGDALDYGGGLKVQKDIAGYSLASITSWDRYVLEDRQDTDSTDIDFSVYQPVSPEGGSANGGYFRIYSRTQEFRLTSPEEDRLRYVAGVFVSDTRSRRYFVRGSNTLDDYNDSPTPSPTPASLPTTNSTAYSRYLTTARATNYALFAQGNFALSGKLDLLAGVRLNREEIEYSFYDLGNGLSFGAPRCSTRAPSGVAVETCNHDTSVTGRTGLQYQFTQDLMGFATFSRGYKGLAYDLTSTLTTRTPSAGGPNAGRPLADAIAANQPVAPETVDSYELGFKGTFFGGRLAWNATAFHMIFEGFQAQSRDQLLNQNLLNSIGKVTSRGVETELAAKFGHLTLNGGAAYNRAVMEDFPNAGCFPRQTAAEGCVANLQDLSGSPLFNVPKWNANLGTLYELPLGESRYSATFSAGYRWQSAVIFNLLQDPDSVQAAYGVANFAVGLRSNDWRLTAFVNNAFDQSYALTRGRDSHFNLPAGGNAINWKPARDGSRYFGLKASFTY